MKLFRSVLLTLTISLLACSRNKSQITPPPPPAPPHVPALYVWGSTLTSTVPSPSLASVGWVFKNGVDTVLRDVNGNQIGGYYSFNNDTSYVLGYIKSGAINIPTLWKNGVAGTIANVSPGASVMDYTFAGNDRYLLCSEISGTGIGAVITTKLWKNGVLTTLSSDSYTRPVRLIVSGSDVYVFSSFSDQATGNYKIRVWKNGIWTNWYGTLGNSNAYGFIIPSGFAVSNGDAYVVGSEQTANGTFATVWKNGVPTHITNNNFGSSAYDIVISGADVYIVGYEGNSIYPGLSRSIAKVWKNGVPTSLTNGTLPAVANKIVIVGTDIYIAGTELSRLPLTTVNEHTPSYLKVWKNGVPANYTDGSTQASIIYMSYF